MKIIALALHLFSREGHNEIYHQSFQEAARQVGLDYSVVVAPLTTSYWKRLLEFSKLFAEGSEKRIIFLEHFNGHDLVTYALASFFFSKKDDYHWLLFRNDFQDNPKKERVLCFFLKILVKRFKKRLCVLSDAEPILLYFEKKLGIKGYRLPIPHTYVPPIKQRGKVLRAWFAGSPRLEKGKKEIEKLRALKRGDHIELSTDLKAPLSREEYLEALMRADVVLLPYDPKAYRVRTSGIFVEAIVAGKVPVVKEGSSLARELRQFQLEELIVDWEDPQFFENLDSLCKNEDMRQKLDVMMESYRSYHSIDSLSKSLASIIRELV